jgi:DNA polymerase-3 subunit epsilon
LEDRRIDPAEGDALVQSAQRWGLAGDQIRSAHSNYLNHLVIAALADGMVTELERNDLLMVARLLGQAQSDLEATLTKAAARLAECKAARPQSSGDGRTMIGTKVCFTGEMRGTYQGNKLTRELAEELAFSKGLEVLDSVTKSLDVLVVADPHTQSGKAKKAQKYGIRVLHEPVFWKALGVEVA